MFNNQLISLIMAPSEYTQYKWLDAEEMRPRQHDDSSQYAANKILQKLFESLISESL